MPKVTVIIPVYNTEKYLKKCLDSVCSQTLFDIEIICVNDCSPDNSIDILREYELKDNRIKVIDFKENKGVSAARNTGIKEAKGEYIGFVDSDDYIDLDFYEKLYIKAVECRADAAKGNYKNAESGYVDYSLNEKIKEDKNNFAYAYCSAIFKKAVLEKKLINFPLIKDMEDPVFTYKFALCANKVEIVDNAHINIVFRKDSATGGVPSFEKIQHKFEGLEKIIDLANASNVSGESYGYVLAFWFYETFFNSVKNFEKEVRNYIADNIFRLYEKIKHRELFSRNLKTHSILLNEYITKKDKNGIIEHGEKNAYKKELFLKIRQNLKK